METDPRERSGGRSKRWLRIIGLGKRDTHQGRCKNIPITSAPCLGQHGVPQAYTLPVFGGKLVHFLRQSYLFIAVMTVFMTIVLLISGETIFCFWLERYLVFVGSFTRSWGQNN